MSTVPDPFDFKSRARPHTYQPAVVVAQPGQEVRIIVPDAGGFLPAIGDSRASPSSSGDSRASPSASGDSRASPSASGDSRSSPAASGDVFSRDAFGFSRGRRGFSPAPMIIIAQPGQEIRIVVPQADGSLPGMPADSRSSPSPSGDRGYY